MTTENQDKQPNWGGRRKGAGRPKVHQDEIPPRTLWLRAADEEWAAFLALLPADGREKFILLNRLASKAAAGDGQGAQNL